jgi:hypothetical protein
MAAARVHGLGLGLIDRAEPERQQLPGWRIGADAFQRLTLNLSLAELTEQMLVAKHQHVAVAFRQATGLPGRGADARWLFCAQWRLSLGFSRFE